MIVEISEAQRDQALEALKNNSETRNLLLMLFYRDFTEVTKLIIEEDDRCEVDLLRGEGRRLIDYIEKLGG